LRRIAQDIEEQIDCTQCANCCKVATAVVTERDAGRLAHHLRIPLAQFLAEYTVEIQAEGRILRRSEETGCVFLEGTACTVYEARPDACQRFPHVVRGAGSIASRMWQFADRATYCPIVYNSLEAFKRELGFRR
jgi:Fe-S-cluster containining protein